MNNITHLFDDLYLPQKAILVYRNIRSKEDKHYVESFDINSCGRPINAHPLSEKECAKLATALRHEKEEENNFLGCKGLLPDNILYIKQQRNGYAVWFTPQQTAQLFFKEVLGIPSGKAKMPALVWCASKEGLKLYALLENKKPIENTPLYYAPFFNLHDDGSVCMGTVDIDLEGNCCLQEFMRKWEAYFWNSYFSHLIGGNSPVKMNIVQLWREQMNSKKKFPTEVLIKRNETIKDIL